MVDEQKNTALCGVQQGLSRRNLLVAGTALVAGAVSLSAPGLAIAQQASSSGGGRKPNILMIMADDIGWFNASIYNHGM
ncbi:arylsulfatase, partial [Rhizobium leguminosarum]|nr:arylsulfatase [Rhizobium ruizarguesonis]